MEFYKEAAIIFALPNAKLEASSPIDRVHVVVAGFSPRDCYLLLCSVPDSSSLRPAKVFQSLLIDVDLEFAFDEQKRSVQVQEGRRVDRPFRVTFPDAANFWSFSKAIGDVKLVMLQRSLLLKALEKAMIVDVPRLTPSVTVDSDDLDASEVSFA